MIDFYKLLTAKQRQKLAARNVMYAEQRARVRALTDENLAATAKYYMTQMNDPRWAPGEPVYDAAMWFAIVPEMIERLEDK